MPAFGHGPAVGNSSGHAGCDRSALIGSVGGMVIEAGDDHATC